MHLVRAGGGAHRASRSVGATAEETVPAWNRAAVPGNDPGHVEGLRVNRGFEFVALDEVCESVHWRRLGR